MGAPPKRVTRRPAPASDEERRERRREASRNYMQRQREDAQYREVERQRWREWHAQNSEELAARKRAKRAADVEAARGERNRQMRSLRAERTARVNEIKVARGCADCGYNAHPVALDFDHRDPKVKTANVSRLVPVASWERVLAEIEKCDVVCANCHRIRTFEAQQWRRPDREWTVADGIRSRYWQEAEGA